MADEKNAAAMLLRRLGEAVEGASGVVGAVTIDRPEAAVQGIDAEPGARFYALTVVRICFFRPEGWREKDEEKRVCNYG
jgi:hypothetical protein